MSSDHDTRAKRDQHGTDAQRDNQVMTDGGDALPKGEEEQDEHGSTRHADVDGEAADQLRIDLLNTFKSAYQADLSDDEIDEAIDFARDAAREDWR